MRGCVNLRYWALCMQYHLCHNLMYLNIYITAYSLDFIWKDRSFTESRNTFRTALIKQVQSWRIVDDSRYWKMKPGVSLTASPCTVHQNNQAWPDNGMLQTPKVRSKWGQPQSKSVCKWGSAKGKGSSSGIPTLARNIYANNIKDPYGGESPRLQEKMQENSYVM
jgi:hypothetical protein